MAGGGRAEQDSRLIRLQNWRRQPRALPVQKARASRAFPAIRVILMAVAPVFRQAVVAAWERYAGANRKSTRGFARGYCAYVPRESSRSPLDRRRDQQVSELARRIAPPAGVTACVTAGLNFEAAPANEAVESGLTSSSPPFTVVRAQPYDSTVHGRGSVSVPDPLLEGQLWGRAC